MNVIERLDWDSSFFGYEVGRIQIEDINDLTTSDFIEKSIKFRLIYIFSKNIIDIPNIRIIDKKIVLSQKTFFLQSNKNILIRSFDINRDSFDRLKELAIQSGKYSRFFLIKTSLIKSLKDCISDGLRIP
ncbi:hypothetical protein [Flavobacterium gyeonganense]|uniref:hypothetical protein n=1 Tax=Flavobacterium gyeonganense TaxID=1310418 RepID=UPI0024146460|nr:hypothetical protein [Flavobacterium gyeonganense]